MLLNKEVVTHGLSAEYLTLYYRRSDVDETTTTTQAGQDESEERREDEERTEDPTGYSSDPQDKDGYYSDGPQEYRENDDTEIDTKDTADATVEGSGEKTGGETTFSEETSTS